MVSVEELEQHLNSQGYELVEVKRWKRHDWIVYRQLPNITYGRIILTCKVEDVPESSILRIFPKDRFPLGKRCNGGNFSTSICNKCGEEYTEISGWHWQEYFGYCDACYAEGMGER